MDVNGDVPKGSLIWCPDFGICNQYIIITDSYTNGKTNQSSSRAMGFKTPTLTTDDLIEAINKLAAAKFSGPFLTLETAINWAIYEGYFITNQEYPSIVTSGCVLNLDSNFPPSYPLVFNAWYDLTGNGNTGLLNNGVFYDELLRGSFLLNGTNQYISFSATTNIPVGNSNYTISTWFKPSSLGTKGLVGWGNYGTTNEVNALRLSSSGIVNYWQSNDLSASYSFNTNNWYNAVATFDGTTRSIWVNGSLIGSDTPSGHNVPNSTNLTVGVTNTTEYFAGNMGEVQIFNRALSSTEITQNYNAFLPRYNGTYTDPCNGAPQCTPTPTGTSVPASTPTPTQPNYKYYFELVDLNNPPALGGGSMTFNSSAGAASGVTFNTNYNLGLYTNSYVPAGSTVSANTGNNITKIEKLNYDGSVAYTVNPATTNYTFGSGPFNMDSTGTNTGQFQSIKVYFESMPSVTPTQTTTPTTTPTPTKTPSFTSAPGSTPTATECSYTVWNLYYPCGSTTEADQLIPYDANLAPGITVKLTNGLCYTIALAACYQIPGEYTVDSEYSTCEDCEQTYPTPTTTTTPTPTLPQILANGTYVCSTGADCDGEFNISSISGGAGGPYQTQLDTGGWNNYPAVSSYTSLCGGQNYSFSVKDGQGNIRTESFTQCMKPTPTPTMTPTPTTPITYYKMDACSPASGQAYTNVTPGIANQRYYDSTNSVFYVWDNTTTINPGTIVSVVTISGQSNCP